MSTKLEKLVKIVHNDNDCVLLEVKKNKTLDLLKTGCFEGNEMFFRITKKTDCCKPHSYTFGYNNGNVFTVDSNTLVSESLRKKMKMIYSTVVHSFGIAVEGKKEDLQKHNYIKTLNDDNKVSHIFEFAGFSNDRMNLRKDGNLIFLQGKMDEELEYLNSKYKLGEMEHKVAPNGCNIYIVRSIVK